MKDLFTHPTYAPAMSKQLLTILKEDISVDLEDYKDPHLIVSVFLSYLQEMVEPLFTFDLYDEITAFTRLREDRKLEASEIIMIYRLPQANYNITMSILTFLLKLLQFRDINHMTPMTVTKIFAPLLLRPRQYNANIVELTVEMHSAAVFLTYLLEHFFEIF